MFLLFLSEQLSPSSFLLSSFLPREATSLPCGLRLPLSPLRRPPSASVALPRLRGNSSSPPPSILLLGLQLGTVEPVRADPWADGPIRSNSSKPSVRIQNPHIIALLGFNEPDPSADRSSWKPWFYRSNKLIWPQPFVVQRLLLILKRFISRLSSEAQFHAFISVADPCSGMVNTVNGMTGLLLITGSTECHWLVVDWLIRPWLQTICLFKCPIGKSTMP